ncbi:hypothetical protein ACFQY5_24280 [Paeniroseomonas aquatica]|uniref:hypothetical protein n=1 Tax=Paeniroseomonas aquatica TaxID=373043 RepID=UPI00360D7624
MSITARVVPTPRLVIAPTVLFTGRSSDFLITNTGDFGSRGAVRGGTVVNLGATYKATEVVSLFLEGRNLGNSRWEPTSGYVTPGRSLLVGTRFAL